MQCLKGVNMIIRLVIGTVAGGLLGYALYRFVGCSTGACPITSNPWISTIYGMVAGILFAATGKH